MSEKTQRKKLIKVLQDLIKQLEKDPEEAKAAVAKKTPVRKTRVRKTAKRRKTEEYAEA